MGNKQDQEKKSNQNNDNFDTSDHKLYLINLKKFYSIIMINVNTI